MVLRTKVENKAEKNAGDVLREWLGVVQSRCYIWWKTGSQWDKKENIREKNVLQANSKWEGSGWEQEKAKLDMFEEKQRR